MEELIKKVLLRLFPELQQQAHLLQFAQVVAIPSPPSDGHLSVEDNPSYAVNIQMLDQHHAAYGPIFEHVPLPVLTAGHSRGQFAFPQVGTVVAVLFAYGNPRRPVIVNVYPFDLHLPALGATETLIQHSPATFMRSTNDENWHLQARNKLWIGNTVVNLVAEVRKLSEWARDHKHPAPMKEAVTKSEAGAIAGRVSSIEK